MDNRIWYHDELDLAKAIEEKDCKAIQEYVTQNKQLIMYLWETEQMPQLKRTLQYGSAELNYLHNWLKKTLPENQLYILYLVGTLAGTVECVDKKTYLQDYAERMTDAIKMMAATKHLSETVLALETHGMMTHAELCKALGMNAPTLTEAMKKILQTGAVKASAYGKYKLYNLTETGRQFGKTIRRQKVDGNSGQSQPNGKTKEFHVGDTLAISHIDRGAVQTDRFLVDMIMQENNQRPDGEIRIGCRKQEVFTSAQLSNTKSADGLMSGAAFGDEAIA